MKKATTGSQAVFTIAVALLSLALGLTFWHSQSLARRVTESKESLVDCQQLVVRIDKARVAPETASNTSQTEEELSRRIEQWARSAKISPKQMIRIDPLSPRRIEDSDYLIQGADIELENLTLVQLASLADAVRREDPRLRISRLRISAPRSEAATGSPSSGQSSHVEIWRGELALTYLLHSPKSGRR